MTSSESSNSEVLYSVNLMKLPAPFSNSLFSLHVSPSLQRTGRDSLPLFQEKQHNTVIEIALSSYHKLIVKDHLSREMVTDQLFYGRGIQNHVVICSDLMAEPRQ